MFSHTDCDDFLIRLVFGNNDDFLDSCVNKAYLDFNRTLHGISKLVCKFELDQQARIILRSLFTNLKDCLDIDNQITFDIWHRQACTDIASLYEASGYSLSVGQAQKWINMTFKYIFTMGENRLPGYSYLYEFCHSPLDNIILAKLTENGFQGLRCAWSRLDDYDIYLDCQNWIRRKFEKSALDVEFDLWLGKTVVAPHTST